MLIALYILIGLLLGSFFNVLILRIPRGESVQRPGSYCPACQAQIRTADLVPLLSYIILRGRCRSCSAKINPRYPAVEMLTALGFVLAYLRYGTTAWTLAGCAFFSVLIITAFTDLETGLIPDRITYPGMIAGLLFSFFTVGWQSSVSGMLAFGGILFLAGFFSDGGMGGGDIKLAATIGAFAGFKMAVLTFVLSSLIGGLWAIGLLIRGKANGKTTIKFGPFLALAAMLVWLWGQSCLDLYFKFLAF